MVWYTTFKLDNNKFAYVYRLKKQLSLVARSGVLGKLDAREVKHWKENITKKQLYQVLEEQGYHIIPIKECDTYEHGDIGVPYPGIEFMYTPLYY